MSDDVLLHQPGQGPLSLLLRYWSVWSYLALSGTQELHHNFPSLSVWSNIAELSSSSGLCANQSRPEGSHLTILADWKIYNLPAHQDDHSPHYYWRRLTMKGIVVYFSCSLYYCPWTDLEAKKVWTESCTWRQQGQAVWSLHHMSILDSDQTDPIYRPCLAQLQHQPPPDQPRPQQHRVKLLKGKKS